jgi:hypothetical protein
LAFWVGERRKAGCTKGSAIYGLTQRREVAESQESPRPKKN